MLTAVTLNFILLKPKWATGRDMHTHTRAHAAIYHISAKLSYQKCKDKSLHGSLVYNYATAFCKTNELGQT